MKHLGATVFAFGALLAVSACKDDEEKKKADVTTESSKETKASSSDDSKARSPQTDYEVATEEDFEDAIQQQITAETDLSQELDRLEREISAK